VPLLVSVRARKSLHRTAEVQASLEVSCSKLPGTYRVLACLCEGQQPVDGRLQQVSRACQQQLPNASASTEHAQDDGGHNLQGTAAAMHSHVLASLALEWLDLGTVAEQTTQMH
jgi:hypothetical protein